MLSDGNSREAAEKTEVVLRRFGGYMWTICRGHLSDPDDANDAPVYPGRVT